MEEVILHNDWFGNRSLDQLPNVDYESPRFNLWRAASRLFRFPIRVQVIKEYMWGYIHLIYTYIQGLGFGALRVHVPNS